MFSINTNNSAMAALQSLQATNTALSQTQNEVSTGLKVSSAADNPAVYAISQAMDANIAGLTAVQDGLSFGAQVVGTASTATSSISSTLNTLKQTITQGQQQGLSAAQMNGSITSALAQIDTFANSATFNGVNLVSGAVGANVQSTSLQVLSDTQGDGFTVGYNGAAALNATSAGLGLSGLTVSTSAVQFNLGSNAAAGMVLTGGANVTVQNANFGNTGTAQNPGQQYVFILNDGSGAAGTDIATKPTGGVATGTQQLGNGSTVTSYATAFDSSGNATQQVNIISVNVGLASGLTSQAGQTTAISDLASAMNAVGFGASVDNSNNLSIAGNNISSTGATTTITNPGTTIAATQLTGAAATIAAVSGAVNKLGNISAQLGDASNQISGLQSFTSSLSNALTAGVGALTDADLATESAKLTSLQTKQQLAIQSLSIANQQPQSLLSLFK